MSQNNNRNFDDKFAEAWYNLGGDFSYMFSKQLIKYLSANNIKPANVLDIYCGAGNFLAEMQKQGIKCVGTEGSKAFVDFNNKNYKDMEFIYSPNMLEFGTKQKFDLITCIYDLVNYLEKFSEWQDFFKNVYKQLNKGGMFVFDYNTTRRLADWNTTIYESNSQMDYVQTVKSGVQGKTIINYVYYIKDKEDLYYKTSSLRTETTFETERVLEALKKAGFKDVKLCDFSLNPVSNPESKNKIHVIATK